MPDPQHPPGRLRAAAGLVALAALALAGVRLADRYLNTPSVPRPIDFLQVWAAGRLHLAGENPYDPVRVLELQWANRLPDDRASMMWNLPWALALVMPVGALPVNAAQVAWLFGLAGLVVGSAVLLWREYGRRERYAIPVAAALLFAPTWFVLVSGQIAAVVLFGVAGFLAASRAGRPVLAGACVALTAVKPHLFVPLAVGLLIDAARRPTGRRVVTGGAIAVAAASVAATLPNPDVWAQYAASATASGSAHHKGLADWMNPTVGAWVRAAVPGRPFWVQWTPAAVAGVAFGAYWWRRGSPEKWPAALPWVVPLGLITAPYGSWMFDQVLLLVPLVAVLARGAVPRWPAVVVYAAANVASLAMLVSAGGLEYYVWFCPVVATCLLAAGRSPARPARPVAA